MIADHAGNEAQKEVFSQRAKTHNFREWCNQQFGTDYALGEYKAVDVKEAEKGRIPVVEVARRLRDKTASHAEAMQMLDNCSVRAAFRQHVDAKDIAPEDTVAIKYGVEGPSVSGKLALTTEDALRMKAQAPSEPVVLVLDHDYSPKDHEAVTSADAVVMLKAGTQHIQVLARNHHMPVLFANREKYPNLSVAGDSLLKHEGLLPPQDFAKAGEWVTVDGTSHTLYAGKLPVREPGPEVVEAARKLAQLGDYHNRLRWHFKRDDDTLEDHTGVKVFANADNAQQVAEAKKHKSVRGIGLLRTEHMFMNDEKRGILLRALAAEGDDKQSALAELTAMHTKDLSDVLALSDRDFPVTIRLFDFPPAEFFPAANDTNAIHETAEKLKLDEEKLRELCARIHDGDLRGAAFSLAFPEIHKAQSEAIFAASEAYPDAPVNVMVPVVRNANQISNLRHALTVAAKGKVFRLGSMIETKELVPEHYADEQFRPIQDVVRRSDFISLGTNDLTQEMLGIKRGDLQAVLEWNYQSRDPVNPFMELTEEVKFGIVRVIDAARSIKPDIEISWCGDQAATRSGAETAQYWQLHSMSVPASEPTITQACVETGRAALLESTAQSEQRDRERRDREEAEQKRKEGKLPDGLVHASTHVLAKSPVAFIIMEDEGPLLDKYAQGLRGQPVITCRNVSDTMEAAEAMHKQGKTVYAYLDANVPFSEYEDTKEHLLCKDVREASRGRSSGVALAWVASEGKIEGLVPERITMMSFDNNDRLPPGAKRHSKGHNTCEWFNDEFSRIVRAHKGGKKRIDDKRKTVVVVDDDEEWLEKFQHDLEMRFNCKVEAYTDTYSAFSRLRKGGVAAALFDEMMPDDSGLEFARSMLESHPEMKVAVITSSDEFVKEQEATGQQDVPVMRKSEALAEQRHNKNNRFMHFMRDALAGTGRQQAS